MNRKRKATAGARLDGGSAPPAPSGPPPSEITSFRGDYHFLSNFYKSPIVQDGIEYPTVEHAFQAAKCLDRSSKLSLVVNKNPVVVKRLGRRVQLRPDWESVKVDLMHEILSLKFAPNTEFATLLLATGEAKLIEGNRWHDNFWGACQCDKHRVTTGANHLGKLLMRVRDELRSSTKSGNRTLTIPDTVPIKEEPDTSPATLPAKEQIKEEPDTLTATLSASDKIKTEPDTSTVTLPATPKIKGEPDTSSDTDLTTVPTPSKEETDSAGTSLPTPDIAPSKEESNQKSVRVCNGLDTFAPFRYGFNLTPPQGGTKRVKLSEDSD
ncbi:hypothetical protein FOCC_FOCC008868 [Frankliniella occidentalis]|uniref:Uncharacterized protein LOC113202783 isoform X2 n=1 Tax=Frankliniella occidentalis TaxID=133901 RepID=A0A6J1RXB2_FRAOC|nr:uncharacterized protein LOC113202783 isoform X2 [Frankliniella occidentalis]KAE8744479.1 hypothetical protein FOCC_FOCC008868 [Frankliniella occidentalis]